MELGSNVPEEHLKRLEDHFDFTQTLLSIANNARNKDKLSSKIAAFSIYSQWIEESLGTWIDLIMASTAKGRLHGYEVKNTSWNKYKERTLGQKYHFILRYEVTKPGVDKDELDQLKALLKQYVVMRNYLTHNIFKLDLDNVDAHKSLLFKKLEDSLELAEKLNIEFGRLIKNVFPKL